MLSYRERGGDICGPCRGSPEERGLSNSRPSGQVRSTEEMEWQSLGDRRPHRR